MQKLIVTGANGVGKSFVATQLSSARPEIPLFSFDALKLTSDWKQRPKPEIDKKLSQVTASDAWIIEGGPSLLAQALPKADVVIWLNPPELLRTWRLMIRPWRNLGKTRPELPEGNRDWPFQQYRFAIRSLKNGSNFRARISACLEQSNTQQIWHCRNDKDIEAALKKWSAAG
ncbi:topology modulation protein [Pseudovibrio axinellae]|uniref:Topology modulation protein n=1 Tax=Pseudovibrio axinellae TaxID=989403 RepID=A0A166A486_9HYPH|nr:DNA topology modulation protein FlaR [Pseudovibrio axinellae]KZL20608.1 topology modulation protein [Pseudovibrio axinellae]SER28002.1 Adenylate kinase [Pseudovibrio axinellae]